MRPVDRGLAALGLCLWASPALAWKHTGAAWHVDDLPVSYTTSDDGASVCAGLPPETCRTETAAAWQAWVDAAECSAFSGLDVGFWPAPAGDGTQFEGVNTVVFDIEVEPGVLAFATWQTSPDDVWVGESTYARTLEGDIVVGQFDYATQEQAEDPDCSGRVNLRDVLIHEIGHLAGLDHSCEEGENCGPEQANAVMNWSADYCEAGGILADDRAGLEALYGPSVGFRCGDDDAPVIVTTPPVTLTCAITGSTLPWDNARWLFGDGVVGEGAEVTHTWTEEGEYSVRLFVDGEHESCGPWQAEANKYGLLRLCAVPEPELHVAQTDDRTWDLLNDTELSVYGCVDSVHWAVYEGTRATGKPVVESINWELTHTFPHDGPWTVVLEVGGEAGTGTATATFGGPEPLVGCSCGQGSGQGAGWLAVGLLVLLRRRH